MYHPGKVIEILSNNDKNVKSCDDSTQAIVEMWDENQFTFLVETALAKKIKKNDIVLIDYRPLSDKLPIPRHTIVKILSGKLGQDVWKTYEKFHDKNKQVASKNMMQQNIAQQYMG